MREEQFSAAIGNWSAEPPHPRFGIYRNNVASALINALRVRYPVTAQLVGKDFFAAMAGAYADKERPSSAVLIDYGNSFPVFIRAFAPAASLLYLGDVGALALGAAMGTVAVIPGLMAPQVARPLADTGLPDPALLSAVAVTLLVGVWRKNAIWAMLAGAATLAAVTLLT